MKINFFDTENLKRNHQAMIKGAALSACALTFAAFVASNIFTAVKLFKNDGANKYINLLSKISIVNTAIFACGALTSIFTCCALYLDDSIHFNKDNEQITDSDVLAIFIYGGAAIALLACLSQFLSQFIASLVQFTKAAKEAGFTNFKDQNVIGFAVSVLPFAIAAASIGVLCMMRGFSSDKDPSSNLQESKETNSKQSGSVLLMVNN